MTDVTKPCRLCGAAEPVWAMQFLGRDTPTFAIVGHQAVGWPATLVCDHCRRLASGKTAEDIVEDQANGLFAPETVK